MLSASYRALESSVAGGRDGQWDASAPCSEWTVTQVTQHAAGDQLTYGRCSAPGALTVTSFLILCRWGLVR
ncbi:maleylpyruvate isomerase N-terminal domain-containing protein [Nonomuraea maritima]|uniref:maleylpyruvate isomerase N-terminal domain-containing protein n=1 Tax=Nonomuraea maritima TaxID=683260 RepID=UPI00371CDAF7